MQMFRCEPFTFGAWQAYRFFHPEAQHGFSLVPERGGLLLDLWLHGRSVLDGYREPAELDRLDWAKSAVLAPFPNRLADGRFSWQGESYRFPLNDVATGNAIHGFAWQSAMKMSEWLADAEQVRAVCRFDYAGDRSDFPFAFTLQIAFTLSVQGDFEVALLAQNEAATSMPLGVGWHPYFKLEWPVDELSLQLPPCEQIPVDQRMLPTGKRSPLHGFERAGSLREQEFDACLALDPSPGMAKVEVAGPGATLRYWQETGPKKFNYLQVFLPPHRRSIALEPMSCGVDAFNLEPEAVLLAPEEEVGGRFGVSLSVG